MRRGLIHFDKVNVDKAVHKMPFVRRVLILSKVELQDPPALKKWKHATVPVKHLHDHQILLSDPQTHGISQDPTVCIANNTLYLDCLLTEARRLGITFAKMHKYGARTGRERCLFRVDLEANRENPRLSFAMERFNRGKDMECFIKSNEIVSCESKRVKANIEELFDEEDHEEYLESCGRVMLGSIKNASDTLYFYKFDECIVTTEALRKLLEDENVIHISCSSHHATIPYKDDQTPSAAKEPPSMHFRRRNNESWTLLNHV